MRKEYNNKRQLFQITYSRLRSFMYKLILLVHCSINLAAWEYLHTYLLYVKRQNQLTYTLSYKRNYNHSLLRCWLLENIHSLLLLTYNIYILYCIFIIYTYIIYYIHIYYIIWYLVIYCICVYIYLHYLRTIWYVYTCMIYTYSIDIQMKHSTNEILYMYHI